MADQQQQELRCGVGQPGHTCDQPAVGALAVQAKVGGLGGTWAGSPPQTAVVLVCVRHLAAFGEPAEAVFPDEQQPPPGPGPIQFPPGAGTRGA